MKARTRSPFPLTQSLQRLAAILCFSHAKTIQSAVRRRVPFVEGRVRGERDETCYTRKTAENSKRFPLAGRFLSSILRSFWFSVNILKYMNKSWRRSSFETICRKELLNELKAHVPSINPNSIYARYCAWHSKALRGWRSLKSWKKMKELLATILNKHIGPADGFGSIYEV